MASPKAPSSRPYFLQRVRERLLLHPSLSGRVEVDENAPLLEGMRAVYVRIPKAEQDGFDIRIQFFDNWEINVIPDECVVDFFLSNKEKDAAWTRQQIDASLNLVLRLLGPRCRVREWYRHGEIFKGRVESLVDGRWTLVAWYRRSQFFWHWLGRRTMRALQNRVLD